jgi:hypothetical protein
MPVPGEDPGPQPELQVAFEELGTTLDDMIEICESSSIPYGIIEVRAHAVE